MTSSTLFFPTALLPNGWASNVRIDIDANGTINGVESNADKQNATSISGVALPGIANVHSHAHQRAIVGLTERAGPGADSFWTWREAMYHYIGVMTPEDLQAIAAQAYVEMLKSGFTTVGEFQYLHNNQDGTPYENNAEMTLACLAAARQTGIGFTALPVLYAYSGFGSQSPTEGQKRFINSAESFLEITSRLIKDTAASLNENTGIAPHSLRAVDKPLLTAVLKGLNEMAADAPVHIHIAEQTKEVDDCISWCGARPVEHLLDHYDVSRRWCAIHATHMTPQETSDLAHSGTVAGLCPTTEANLGDGIFPASAFIDHSGTIAIGSDSHITISPAEDLRMLEYSQRLRDRARNVLADAPGVSTGRSLFQRATIGGGQALNRKTGTLAKGMRADILVLDGEHPSLAERIGDAVLDSWIFSAGDTCVRDVFSGGQHLINNKHHDDEEKIFTQFRAALKRLQDRTG